MATTYKLGDYAANGIREFQALGLRGVAGQCTEGATVHHPFTTLVGVLLTATTALAAATQLYADVSTAGQVTITDGANTGDTIAFLILGI